MGSRSNSSLMSAASGTLALALLQSLFLLGREQTRFVLVCLLADLLYL